MGCQRNCAFVNYTNISNAIKAIDGVKNMPEYANLRVAHGKDRCANPPRSGPQGASGARRSGGNGNGHAVMAEPMLNGEDIEDEMKSDAVFLGGELDIDDSVVEPGTDGLGMHIDEEKPLIITSA
jgi:hypothetical protein